MVDTVIWCIICFLLGLMVGMGMWVHWMIKQILKWRAQDA